MGTVLVVLGIVVVVVVVSMIVWAWYGISRGGWGM